MLALPCTQFCANKKAVGCAFATKFLVFWRVLGSMASRLPAHCGSAFGSARGTALGVATVLVVAALKLSLVLRPRGDHCG